MLGRTNAMIQKTVSTLTTPATKEQIVQGFEVYDSNLDKIVGTMIVGSGGANPLVVANDDEMKQLLADNANMGQYVKFAGSNSSAGYVQNQTYKLCARAAAEHFAVGDALTKMYFDSTKTIDVDAIKANCPSGLYDDYLPYWMLIDAGHIDDSILFLEYTAEMTEGIEGLDGTESFSFIATTYEFRAQLWCSKDMAIMADIPIKTGWQMESYVPTKKLTVTSVQGQDAWGEYITKTPGGNFAEPYYPLKTLEQSAMVSEIASGKEVYNSIGEKIVGTATIMSDVFIEGGWRDGVEGIGGEKLNIELNYPIKRIRPYCFAYMDRPNVTIGSAEITGIQPYAFYRSNVGRGYVTGRHTYDFRKLTTLRYVAGHAFSGNDSAYTIVFFPVLPNNAFTIFYPSGSLFSGSMGMCYLQNTSPPTLPYANDFADYTYVPYNRINVYKTETQWVSIASQIYGWAPEGTFSIGYTLPTTNSEGISLTWYSDDVMTSPISVVEDNKKIHYCKAV